MNYIKSSLLLLTLVSSIAHALLEVNIIKSHEDSFPIVIAPFKVGGGADNGAIIANIIRDNLNRSGQFNAISTSKPITNQIDFNYWKNQKKMPLYLVGLRRLAKRYSMSLFMFTMFTLKSSFSPKKLQYIIPVLEELHII